MDWGLNAKISTNSPPSPPPPVLAEAIENRISPSILLIIVILAVIFFISGLLHLMVRYLLRPTSREASDGAASDDVTALQGQLQQLFHLHDAGVDQSFIDALPVFLYKAIIGIKDPFDCAVCLCEFEPDDKLRLLPNCSHAFHLECIDTWLLSHSTCPLCRGSLIPDLPPHCASSPLLLVLESPTDASTVDSDHDLGFLQEDDFGAKPPDHESAAAPIDQEKVVQVKLGKFKNVDASTTVGASSSAADVNLDETRRCFSMGSYEYVMNETSFLQVAIKPQKKKPGRFKKPGVALSECDCQSRREGFRGFDPAGTSARIGGGTNSKRESFSVSKIWLRSKKDKPNSSECGGSRRAFSFRLPLHHDLVKGKASVSPATVGSEFEASEMDLDVEVGSCNNSILSMGSQLEEAPSFARRTLLWIVGRQQNRVGSHV